jgi:hypothetical protein
MYTDTDLPESEENKRLAKENRKPIYINSVRHPVTK